MGCKPVRIIGIAAMLGATGLAAQQQAAPARQDDRRPPPNGAPSREGTSGAGARQDAQRGDRYGQAYGPVMLVPSAAAIGTNVVARDDRTDDVGEVADLIVDVPNGRVAYALVSRGGVLGVGATTVAIPWRSLDWDSQQRRLVLPMTEQQLDDAPEFDPGNWSLLGDENWRSRMGRYWGTDDRWGGTDDDGWWGGEAYQQAVGDGRTETYSGTVEWVDRAAPREGMGEGRVAQVRLEDGKTVRVHLGPSWYLDRQPTRITVGDRVEIEGYSAGGDAERYIVARTIRGPGGEYQLRDERGWPRWDASRRAENGGADQGRPDDAGRPGAPQQREAVENGRGLRGGMRGQFLRVSEVDGETLRSNTAEDLGTLESIVFDARTGRIAHGVVAFGGLLGMGESRVAVPWGFFNVNNQGALYTTRFDEATMKRAPRLESGEFEDVTNPQAVAQAYRHFGLDAGWLERGQGQRDDSGARRPGDDDEAGSRRGMAWNEAMREAYRQGEQVELSGAVASMRAADPMHGLGRVGELVVRTDQGDVAVVTSPSSFIEGKSVTIREGDRITVMGRRVELRGRSRVFASEIRTADGRQLTLRSEDGTPLWESGR